MISDKNVKKVKKKIYGVITKYENKNKELCNTIKLRNKVMCMKYENVQRNKK